MLVEVPLVFCEFRIQLLVNMGAHSDPLSHLSRRVEGNSDDAPVERVALQEGEGIWDLAGAAFFDSLLTLAVASAFLFVPKKASAQTSTR